MIYLSDETLIGKGTNRSCYLYPNNDSLCVKITHSNDFSEMQREVAYYKTLQNKNISWEYIAQYHGSIETSLGDGELFDLIKDYDGEVSKTLSYYLQKDQLTKSILDPIPLLKSLKQYTLDQSVVVKDLNTKNMLYQKIDENSARLVLIDGVLNNDYLPFTKYIDFFTKRKIDRLWKRFEESLPHKYHFNKYFLELLNKKS